MNISVFGFSIGFTFEEAQRLADALLGAINRDRVYICILLDFSFKFLQDWYNEAFRAIQPAVTSGGFKDLTKEQKTELKNFLGGSYYVPVADRLYSNFVTLIEDYDHSELKKIIKNEEDFKMITGVYSNIALFKNFAVMKNKWIEQMNNPEWDFDPAEYEKEWRSRLLDKVNDTNNRLIDLSKKSKMNCTYNDIRKVAEKYEREKKFV